MKLIVLMNIYFLSNISLVKALNLENLFNLDAEFPVVFVNILMNQGESTFTFEDGNDNKYTEEKMLLNPLTERNIAEYEQLTNAGIRDEYDIGKWLRYRYSPLLHQRYWKSDIYVSSIDTDSCIASAQAVMAGMFQPRGADVWHQGLNWQPVPVHVKPFSPHRMIPTQQNCKKERYAKGNNRSNTVSNETQEHISDNLLSYISDYTNFKIEDTDLSKIYNIFEFRRKNNLTLPKWAMKIYPEPLREARKLPFQPDVLTEKLKKIRTGPLLKDMVSHFTDKIKHTLQPDRNLWVYTGIGTYITYILKTLKTTRSCLPEFSDLLLLELRRSHTLDNSYFVTLFYKSKEKVYFLKMADCDLICPLDAFKLIIKAYLPKDEDCKVTSGCESVFTLSLSSIIISGLILLIHRGKRYD